ncbi:MAG TPA: DUF393 domain-containing protein [Pyrinomonadaceae bacterium]|jgi:predicted DCC family thiol-disulfide oxidoreductase YuxK
MRGFKTLNIIYDGHCGFCIRSLRIVRALDLYHSFRFYDSHQPETLAQFPQLREANLDEAMYALGEGEPAYEGFFAFRRSIWNSPLLWPLIPIFYFPGASFLGPRVYAAVARSRSRFGCHSDSCDLPFQPGA